MKIVSFLKLVRFKNLFIVALTQYLLQYLVLVPSLRVSELSPLLDFFHFTLLVITTLLIAAGGYLINDLLDYETDLINKPNAVYVKQVFSSKLVWIIYGTTVALGFTIAWYLAGYAKNPSLVLIYPAAVLLLYAYSWQLKKNPVIGNVVVAIFCAFVAGIVLFADRHNFGQMNGQRNEVAMLFGGYLLFAFLSTLLREIIKDLEDMEGDAILGLQTLPIRFGIKTAKISAMAVGVALLFSLLVFVYWLLQRQELASLGFTVFVVLPLLGYILVLLRNAEKKTDFAAASRWAKALMLSGLVLLIVCKIG